MSFIKAEKRDVERKSSADGDGGWRDSSTAGDNGRRNDAGPKTSPSEIMEMLGDALSGVMRKSP